ncbi:MAG: S8 family serine peptidase, partial [Candidatus Eisenbacteria bacterium]|nr:S8 family serine peptidase [Candidatus Eisenbacteria bacterium]
MKTTPRPYRILLFSISLVALVAAPCLGAPWVWDQDQDGIDDRLAAVAASGINQAFESGDPEMRQRFEVVDVAGVLSYGAYVLFDHLPTQTDADDLALIGAQIVTRFESVNYIRVRATYPTLLLIESRTDVIRLEAVTLMYPLNFKSTRSISVGEGGVGPFPRIESNLTGSGTGIAILDTGINDEAQGSYPGHAFVIGKVEGGASFDGPGPVGYTDWSSSMNPKQSSLGLMSYHATHVAASASGGDRSRALAGVAPDAYLIDVKVLTDQGIGYGLAEGIEWCIQNKNQLWSAGKQGIDILNISVSGTDASDGSDAVCKLVDAARDAGMVVVVSAGNDPACGAMSSPSAAEGAITVGASDPLDAVSASDDVLASFTTHGPRLDDGDADFFDEMKPDIVAPGIDVVSAWGDPISDGDSFIKASGSSMSAALVSGAVALLLEVDPALTPSQLKTLLKDTAWHRYSGASACAATDPFNVDARYHTGWGYGSIDVMAAKLELENPTSTQFLRVHAAWNDANQTVSLDWVTQRELDLTGFKVERAPDNGGAPGAFAMVGSSQPQLGFADLTLGNRTNYTLIDTPTPGSSYWYRVVTEGGVTPVYSPAVLVKSEAPQAVATVSLRHPHPEQDLGLVLGSGLSLFSPDWSSDLSFLDCLIEVDKSALGTPTSQVPYTLQCKVPAGAASTF